MQSGTFTPEVSAGFAHTCALKSDGTVICWGDNSKGQTTVPAGLNSVDSLTAGGYFTCADVNGTATCWGDDTYGQTDFSGSHVTSLSAGYQIVCGILDDGVVCSGDITYGQPGPSRTGYYVQVSVGLDHTCGLEELDVPDGPWVECWGYDTYGQTNVPTGLRAVQLSAGGEHTCAIDEGGNVVCWGANGNGQTTVPSGVPYNTWQVSAGLAHTCALESDSTVVCWGADDSGQTMVPKALRGVVQVSAGAYHTCALKYDGNVVCWGSNAFGQTTLPSGLNLDNVNPPVALQGRSAYAANEGAAISFDGSFSTDPYGYSLTFDWDYGDGSVHGTGVTPSHIFAKFGTYTVTLTVTDPYGTSNSAAATATIADVAPVVSALPNAAISPGGTYSAAGTFSDPGADVWTATVDYGDGSGVQALALSGKSFALSHTYTRIGVFGPQVVVADDGGLRGASGADISTNNHPPVANAGGPYRCEEGTDCSISGLASFDPDGDPLRFSWDFGDHTASTQPVVKHDFPTFGTYTIQLEVSDIYGASSLVSTTATVTDLPPSITSLTATPDTLLLDVLTGKTSSFTLSGTFSDPGWGDTWTGLVTWAVGLTSQPMPLKGYAIPPLQHSYSAAGTCTVTARVTDNGGLSAQHAVTVVVEVIPLSVLLKAEQGVNWLSLIGVFAGLPPLVGVNASLQAAWNRANRVGQNCYTGRTAAMLASAPQPDTSGAAEADVNRLRELVKQVNALMRSGRLPASPGQAFVDAVNQIIRP